MGMGAARPRSQHPKQARPTSSPASARPLAPPSMPPPPPRRCRSAAPQRGRSRWPSRQSGCAAARTAKPMEGSRTCSTRTIRGVCELINQSVQPIQSIDRPALGYSLVPTHAARASPDHLAKPEDRMMLHGPAHSSGFDSSTCGGLKVTCTHAPGTAGTYHRSK